MIDHTEAEKWIMLEAIDQAWKQHMLNLDTLKKALVYVKSDKKILLIEYKRESFAMFEDMMRSVRWEIVHQISHIDIERFDQHKIEQRREDELRSLNMIGGQETTIAGVTLAQSQGQAQQSIQATVAVGRNEPCECGSGKKYKKCCGK